MARRCFSPPLAEALLADHRVVTLRHAQNEFVGQGVARGLFHQLQVRFRLAVGNVIAHRVIEENRLLRNLGNLAA